MVMEEEQTAMTPVTQARVGKFLTVANERGDQFRGTVQAVTPGGAVVEVYRHRDGKDWVTLRRPELRTVRGAQVVSDGR